MGRSGEGNIHSSVDQIAIEGPHVGCKGVKVYLGSALLERIDHRTPNRERSF